MPAGVSPKPILVAHGKMVVKKILALQTAAAAAAGDAGDGGEDGDKDEPGHESAPVLEGAYKHPKLTVTELLGGHNIQFATLTVRRSGAVVPALSVMCAHGVVGVGRTWGARGASC